LTLDVFGGRQIGVHVSHVLPAARRRTRTRPAVFGVGVHTFE
jgi:hypothetical protein